MPCSVPCQQQALLVPPALCLAGSHAPVVCGRVPTLPVASQEQQQAVGGHLPAPRAIWEQPCCCGGIPAPRSSPPTAPWVPLWQHLWLQQGPSSLPGTSRGHISLCLFHLPHSEPSCSVPRTPASVQPRFRNVPSVPLSPEPPPVGLATLTLRPPTATPSCGTNICIFSFLPRLLLFWPKALD